MHRKLILLWGLFGLMQSLSASEPESALSEQPPNLPIELICESSRHIPFEDRLRLKTTCKALSRYVDELHNHKDYREEFVFTLIQKKHYGMEVTKPKKTKPKSRAFKEDSTFLGISNAVARIKIDFKLPSSIEELRLMCEGKNYESFYKSPGLNMFDGTQYTFWLFMHGIRDGYVPLVRYSLGLSETFDSSNTHPLANLLKVLRLHPQRTVDCRDKYGIPAAWFTILAIADNNRFQLLDVILEDSVCCDFFFNLWSLLQHKEEKISFPAFNIWCILTRSSPEFFNYVTNKESFKKICTHFINSNELKNIEISNEQINLVMTQTILKLESLQIFPNTKSQPSALNDYAPITELDDSLYDISTNKESYKVFSKAPASFIPTLSAVGCFIQRYGKILLLKRANHKAEGNTWGIPGGKIDSSETPLQAILREVLEETGISLTEQSVKDIGTNYLYLPRKQVLFQMYHLWIQEDPEIILSPDEHVDFQWVTPELALQMNLMPGEIESFVRYYQMMGMRFPMFKSEKL